MEAVAGKVLGPRPGKAICSFWQGTLEIVFWILPAVIGSLPALIAAAVALAMTGEVEVGTVLDNNRTVSDAMIAGTNGISGFILAFSVLSIILLILFIVLRICNIGAFNLVIKAFLGVVIILNIILLIGYVIGGVFAAYFANEWVVGGEDGVGDALASSAAFCFVAAILLLVSVFWDIVYLVKDWNTEVVKYTLKDAVLG